LNHRLDQVSRNCLVVKDDLSDKDTH
jgi:hypothetical protein